METPKVMPYEILEQTLARNPYIPQRVIPTDRQLAFLELECLDALFGGAAGGGKSEALLMAALQFAEVPGYAALIVRRNLTDLKLPGGLLDRANDWLKGKAHYNAQEHRWRFKSGATLQFGYADKEGDEQRYHGAEFQICALDEAVQFTEKQIKFFFERIRKKVEIPVPLRVRLGTTPGGVSHEFLKKRYIDPGTPGKVFVPAKLRDNPHLDEEQYIESLAEVDPMRRAQMLDGDWNAIEGGRIRREWLGWYETDEAMRDTVVLHTSAGDVVERFQPARCSVIQTCDPSAAVSKDSDYFVLSTWLITPKANVVWRACHRNKYEFHDQLVTCQRLYRTYEPQFIAIEEVLNQRALAQEARRSRTPVMVVVSVTPRGQNKLDRAAGFINLAASGRVFLPLRARHDFPLDDVLDELVRFTGDSRRDGHDDICLVAGTQIATATGERPIENIRAGERVWTRKGLRRVLAAGMTSAEASVVTVTLSDGRQLTGTRAHRVFVIGRGFARLDTLSYDDRIAAWETCEKNGSNSRGELTPATRTRRGVNTASTFSRTRHGKGECDTYTATSGSSTTGQFRPGTRYTTLTATRSTMPSKTSCVLTSRNTDGSTPSGVRTRRLRSTPTCFAFARSLQRGTEAQKGERGTAKTQKPALPNGNQSPAFAVIVARGSRRSIQVPHCAATPVLPPTDAHRELMTKTGRAQSAKRYFASASIKRPRPVPARVATVSEAGRCAVFNLTVEGEPEYFANGILTHNCDTASYMAEVLPRVRAGGSGTAKPPVWHHTKAMPGARR
jgi:phage terminase large subunit-like protein